MKKIVITGGLGYIGTELCKIYSGESRYKKIVVLDKRFISERVKQLRDWGIEYINGDILNEELVKNVLSDADTVIHLAGITDVAYTKSEINKERDERIRSVGIDGTRNIIKYSSNNCKIIFPSTHVVFEGLKNTKINISESEETVPILPYSLGKCQSEQDLIESGKDYIILRLASVYGYSQDTMRVNIMPNLFSKITSQNGTIKLFSGGKQLKSLVPLIDVARCFKFMEESNIKKQIFHCSKESVTVRKVAEMCNIINPNLKIVSTDDEIPNLGYTLSNKKLLETGFEFLYDLENCLKEMINNWSEKQFPEELEYILKGGKSYVDKRGKIHNYELTEPINLIGYIESKAGTVRANHYHPIQEQKCLLIKGQYISVFKDLSVNNAPLQTQIINEGDLSVIKPNVAHTMVFTEDSIFLNLVRGEREHDNYGITHTKPYVLVDEKMRDKLLKNYRTTCRSCGGKNLKKFISLGESPLANNLLDSKNEEYDSYPLDVNFCSDCKNCQLSCTVDSKKMFDNYLYVSSTSKKFRKHFEKAAKKYVKRFNLNDESVVVDIGSNDGISLKPLNKLGVKTVGVEPAKNIAALASDAGIETINEYFSDSTVKKILKKYGKVDLVTASNVFAHADDLTSIVKNTVDILKENGTFIIEVQYILDTLKDLTFDNIYHEHVNYWSVTSLVNFFTGLGLTVVEVEHVDTHGGSIRVYVQKSSKLVDKSVERFLNKEKKYCLNSYETYKSFSIGVHNIKKNVINNLNYFKKAGKKVVGYGSPAKATTACNFFGINNTHLKYVIEDNELKSNKYIPGTGIQIRNKKDCLQDKPDVVVVLAWNFFDYIKEKNKNMIEQGCKFISIKDLESTNFCYKTFSKKRLANG